jgi:hypothetical protein
LIRTAWERGLIYVDKERDKRKSEGFNDMLNEAEELDILKNHKMSIVEAAREANVCVMKRRQVRCCVREVSS